MPPPPGLIGLTFGFLGLDTTVGEDVINSSCGSVLFPSWLEQDLGLGIKELTSGRYFKLAKLDPLLWFEHIRFQLLQSTLNKSKKQ